MFDIGWSELLVIGVIALVVVGPRELPGLLRQAGRAMAGVRRMASDFQSQFNEAMREAELDGLRKEVDELRRTASGFTNPAALARDHLRDAIESSGTKPAVTPADVTEALPDPTGGAPFYPEELPPVPAAEPASPPSAHDAIAFPREAEPVPVPSASEPAPLPATSEALLLPEPVGTPATDTIPPEQQPARQP